MIQRENIIAPDRATHNGVSELIAIAGVRNEQKAIKRHVEFAKVDGLSEDQVVLCNSGGRPNETEPLLTNNPVRFFKRVRNSPGRTTPSADSSFVISSGDAGPAN